MITYTYMMTYTYNQTIPYVCEQIKLKFLTSYAISSRSVLIALLIISMIYAYMINKVSEEKKFFVNILFIGFFLMLWFFLFYVMFLAEIEF